MALACTEGGKLGPITVDYCCGRGGKTLSLAMLLDHDRNPGIVLAHDIDTAAIRDLNVLSSSFMLIPLFFCPSFMSQFNRAYIHFFYTKAAF